MIYRYQRKPLNNMILTFDNKELLYMNKCLIGFKSIKWILIEGISYIWLFFPTIDRLFCEKHSCQTTNTALRPGYRMKIFGNQINKVQAISYRSYFSSIMIFSILRNYFESKRENYCKEQTSLNYSIYRFNLLSWMWNPKTVLVFFKRTLAQNL